MCFVRDISSCTEQQQLELANHNGTIINGVLYNSSSEFVQPPPLPPYPPPPLNETESSSEGKKHVGSGDAKNGAASGVGGSPASAIFYIGLALALVFTVTL